MVRAETYASKWAFPRKAASAAPSCMVNVPFHFYCPKEHLVATGISQNSQRGCWWLITAAVLVSSSTPAQPSLGPNLPSLPTYFFQLHLSHLILPSPAVFFWWANSSWGFVRPLCTKLLPTSIRVEPYVLHPSTSPETTSPSPPATGVDVLSSLKQNSQGIGSKHRSCFGAVLVTFGSFTIVWGYPSNWDIVKCLGGSGGTGRAEALLFPIAFVC